MYIPPIYIYCYIMTYTHSWQFVKKINIGSPIFRSHDNDNNKIIQNPHGYVPEQTVYSTYIVYSLYYIIVYMRYQCLQLLCLVNNVTGLSGGFISPLWYTIYYIAMSGYIIRGIPVFHTWGLCVLFQTNKQIYIYLRQTWVYLWWSHLPRLEK